MSLVSFQFSTTLSCSSCLSKLRPILDGDERIVEWEVDLADARKRLLVKATDMDAESIVSLVKRAGFDALELKVNESLDLETSSTSTATSFRLSIYWPLFLVVCYVIGMASFSEWLQGDWVWRRWMGYFMGFFFIGFAFFKLLDVPKFSKAFASYDIVAAKSSAYGHVYPFIELALGLLFVTQTSLPIANGLTILVMGVGLIGVVNAVRNEREIQCACLGTAFNLPMSGVTIVENSVMLLMAVLMLLVG